MPKSTECKHGTEMIGVAEALRIRDKELQAHRPAPEFLCPSCDARVYGHKTGTTGQGAHFEHRPKNSLCKSMS